MASVFPQGHVKALVIYNGVSVPPTKDIKIKSLGTSGDVKLRRIGFFGSDDHRKGLDILMRAVSHLKNWYPNVILDVWGRMNSNRYQSLLDLAAMLGISENLQLRGFCENVPERLAEYSLVALPSRAEAFPMLALEAMAAAVPLVVTRCGGPEELVVDGVDGFVVPVDDHYSLANAMALSFSVPQKTLEMAQRARKKVATEFELSDKLEAILDQMRLVSRSVSPIGASTQSLHRRSRICPDPNDCNGSGR
jgi:glycosyltransferase involved in cell wall biosynthesis